MRHLILGRSSALRLRVLDAFPSPVRDSILVSSALLVSPPGLHFLPAPLLQRQRKACTHNLVVSHIPTVSSSTREQTRPHYTWVHSKSRPSPVLEAAAPSGAQILLLAILAGACAATTFVLRSHLSEPGAIPESAAGLAEEMEVETSPGRPGNLTAEQEEKLRLLWATIFRVCGVGIDESNADASDNPEPITSKDHKKSDLGKTEKDKKKRKGLFSRKAKKDTDSDSVASKQSGSSAAPTPKEGEEDKYDQTKLFHETLASQSPETIRATIWSMVKHDHPDALVLRFLRARKWDVDKAVVMLVSTMNWRAKEMHVDDDIMKNGEAAAVEAESSDDPKTKKLGQDFLAQIRMGKSFLHGIDKDGRPICIVRVRLHRQGEQAEESLERYTVYIIETARMLLTPPVDTASIIFDMTGFSMANMDYTPVKFMIRCFEANYPESLGTVLVHKAPWIFQGIWKIIRGWLDPVVASKVHFTNNVNEMAEFVNKGQILKELDGDEDWEYHYVEPVPGENAKMKDEETKEKLLASRELLYKEFEDATLEWIKSPDGEQGKITQARRADIAQRLREDYWNLDPYIRARSIYDRTRILGSGGKLDYYPKPPTNGVIESNGSAVQTSADDVD